MRRGNRARRILHQKAQQRFVEQIGFVEERKMAALGHHHDLGAGHLIEQIGLIGLNDLVAPAMNDQRWNDQA